MSWIVALVAFFFCLNAAVGHSLLGEPQPISPKHCRLGGIPTGGLTEECAGPCDVRPIFRRPDKPRPVKTTAKYARGEEVAIKYQRNNHPQGGFVRLSLVPIEQMMNKTVHANNAFHYGCWGDRIIPSLEEERGRRNGGHSLVGSDGKNPRVTPSFYQTDVTIPTVVPDGIYALGWTWYGGTGGTVLRNVASNPHKFGLFADYWSCAFIEIEGGPTETSYTPVFKSIPWSDGCNAANDHPGVCVYEPCHNSARIRKPREFLSGVPPALRANNFVTLVDKSDLRAVKVPPELPLEETRDDALAELKSCRAKLPNPPDETGVYGDLTKILDDLYYCRVELAGPEMMENLQPLFDEMGNRQ